MNKLSYINITTRGCKGWINLFIDDQIFACVDNPYVADKIRKAIDSIPSKIEDFEGRVDIHKRLEDFIEFAEKTHRFHDADFYKHCEAYIKELEDRIEKLEDKVQEEEESRWYEGMDNYLRTIYND